MAKNRTMHDESPDDFDEEDRAGTIADLQIGGKSAHGKPQVMPHRMQTSRLTVRRDIYHETPDSEPRQISSAFDAVLSDDEEAYQRKVKLTEQWVELDAGWVKECSLLILKNVETLSTGVVPTDEEKAVLQSKVIEIGFDRTIDGPRDCILIRPGRSCDFEPSSIGSVRLRCRNGQAKCLVTVVPA